MSAMDAKQSDMEQSLRDLDDKIQDAEIFLLSASGKEKLVAEAKLADWKQRRERIATLLVAELKRKVSSNR
jgi:hypothetical protein